jgi:hypothetical protein
LKISQKVVTPVETGVQGSCNYLKELDSGFRRNDGEKRLHAFYETIKIANCKMRISLEF